MDYPLKATKRLVKALKPGKETGRAVVMSPDKYLEHAKRLPDTKEDKLLIDAFKGQIKKGRKLKPLKLLAHNRADGRHRATAAEELGIKEVPVIDYRQSGIKDMKGIHSIGKKSKDKKVKEEVRKERAAGGPILPLGSDDPNEAFRRLISWSFATAPLWRHGAAEGGAQGDVNSIEEAIRAANAASEREGMSHERGMSGAVEFAPIGVTEPLSGARLPLGSLPKETARVVEPALQAASEIAPYFTPAAPIAAARDVAVGLREGDPTNVALSALGLPGKAAKAAAIGASALMPDEAEAGTIDKALKAIKAASKYAQENDLLNHIGQSKMAGDEKLLFDEGKYSAGVSSFPWNNKRSIRYLHHDEEGNPIGALQIMTHGPRTKQATIQNIYVAEDQRRKKIASDLLAKAREDYDVKHSKDLTDQGRAFAKAVKSTGGSIVDHALEVLSKHRK